VDALPDGGRCTIMYVSPSGGPVKTLERTSLGRSFLACLKISSEMGSSLSGAMSAAFQRVSSCAAMSLNLGILSLILSLRLDTVHVLGISTSNAFEVGSPSTKQKSMRLVIVAEGCSE